jgi:negative elongation factor A
MKLWRGSSIVYFSLINHQLSHSCVQQWKPELEEILEVAQIDSDRWVSVLAEIMKSFPSNYSINADNFEGKHNKRIFDELVHDLRRQCT